ncbi:mpv17-like protein [Ixodes scapularis]|uniref:mpv17-like protein n=1 Tax=Ixodes scapularis TaxID=6945 RepID=UPI001A9F8CFC|nr:mpv17-like protein [Ixodes scapularis]
MEHVYLLFNDQLKTHPILTQIAAITLLTFLGDVLSQLTFQRKPFSVKQAAIFFFIGLTYTGPLVVSWFAFVEWLVVMDRVPAIILKVALGEFVFTPPFVLCVMFLHGFLHGHSWELIREDVRVKYLSILMMRCVVFPVSQLVNFLAVPVNYRPIFSSLLALFWSVYLSWKANRAESKLEKLEEGTSDEDEDADNSDNETEKK